MRKLIRIIPKKTGLLILILMVQQISLVFSYSAVKVSLIIERHVAESLPLFEASNINGLTVLKLNSYFDDEIDRWEAMSAELPSKIMTEGIRSQRFLAHFLKEKNSKISLDRASTLAQIYIEEAGLEGVNHDIAFTQMCHETGFLKFTGSVKPEQNNFCGLGATNEFDPGDSFRSVRIGIRAHIQHLKAYADHQSFKTKLVDTRYKFIKRGSATTVRELTGKWAQDPKYHTKINHMLEDLYSL